MAVRFYLFMTTLHLMCTVAVLGAEGQRLLLSYSVSMYVVCSGHLGDRVGHNRWSGGAGCYYRSCRLCVKVSQALQVNQLTR